VTHRATISQTSTDRIVGFDVTRAVAFVRSLALLTSKLALKELASATNRTKWIAFNDEYGRAWSVGIAAPGANLISQRFGDTCLSPVWRQGLINQLSRTGSHAGHQQKLAWELAKANRPS
jgi:hypothetical protein